MTACACPPVLTIRSLPFEPTGTTSVLERFGLAVVLCCTLSTGCAVPSGQTLNRVGTVGLRMATVAITADTPVVGTAPTPSTWNDFSTPVPSFAVPATPTPLRVSSTRVPVANETKSPPPELASALAGAACGIAISRTPRSAPSNRSTVPALPESERSGFETGMRNPFDGELFPGTGRHSARATPGQSVAVATRDDENARAEAASTPRLGLRRKPSRSAVNSDDAAVVVCPERRFRDECALRTEKTSTTETDTDI
jgi:hypothetical protein